MAAVEADVAPTHHLIMTIPYSRIVKRLCLYLHRKEMGAYVGDTA